MDVEMQLWCYGKSKWKGTPKVGIRKGGNEMLWEIKMERKSEKLGLEKGGLGAGEKSHLDSCWEVWILCADYSARF